MIFMELNTHIDTFFRGINITIDALEVTEDSEGVNIRIQTPDSPILIGMHGKNREALEHLLGRMIEKIRGEFQHVHLEINDYMKEKNERLFRFLDKKIAFLRTTGGKIALPELTPYERKKAHNYIHELQIDGLSSESEGQKQERTLYLKYSGTPVIPAQPHTTTPSRVSLDSLSEDGVGI